MDDRCTIRSGHVAVCQDNHLLVWGGFNEMNNGIGDRYFPQDELWVYNSETKAWQKIELSSSHIPDMPDMQDMPDIPDDMQDMPDIPDDMPDMQDMPERDEREWLLATCGSAANVLNGYLYLFGGHNEYTNTNHLLRLDLKEYQWEWIREDTDKLQPSPRDKLSSWAHGEKLYYFGGYGPSLLGYLQDNGEFVKDIDASAFHLRGKGWNNQLLVFDTRSNTWSNPKCKGDVPSARAAHAAALLGQEVFLFGGRHLQQRLGDLYQLDLNTFTWKQVLNMTSPQPVGRSWHTLTTVTDSLLFLYGGYTQDRKPLDDAWILNITTMQWSELHISQKRPRLWHTTCVTKDKDILVFGGCSSDILELLSPIVHCNEVLEFRVSPKSLLRSCMDYVFDYRDVSEQYWNYLPKHLTETLRARLEAFDRNAGQSGAHGDGNNHGQTCALS